MNLKHHLNSNFKISSFKLLSINLFILVIYYLSGKFSLDFAFLNQSASPFWLPTGISIIAFIFYGYKIWPAIFIAAFFVNVTTTGVVLSSLGIAFGNTLEGAVALFLINRIFNEYSFFDSPSEIIKYFLILIFATLLSALIGNISLSLFGLVGNNFEVLFTWWIGDLGGALIFASVFLLWFKDHKIKWSAKKTFELLFVLVLLISTTLLIFDYPYPVELPYIIEKYPFPLLTFPLFLYASFRFGLRETASFIIIFFIIAFTGILNGSPRMQIADSNQSILNLQIFTIIVFILKMSVAAAVTQLNKLKEDLNNKISQFSTISELGLTSLSGKSLQEVMQFSLKKLHEILNIDYSKILKLLPDEKHLLLIEGIGWKEGLVGSAKISTDHNSQAGYTLLSKEPVIVTDLRTEKRFNGPELLKDHNVISGMSCIIFGKEKPFGVLGIHSSSETLFTKNDIAFLQSVANIIALTIERNEYEEEIISSLKEKEILIQEIHHRVKNNLQIISSLLNLQFSKSSPANYKDFFIKSQNRVRSISIVHEMLYKNKKVYKIDFYNYVSELTKFLISSYDADKIEIIVNSESINLNADTVICLGLIITEIVSNSFKYAFGDKSGKVFINFVENNKVYCLTIKDNGKGLPDNFDTDNTNTLGIHLINNLVNQLGGEIEIINNNGAQFNIQFAA